MRCSCHSPNAVKPAIASTASSHPSTRVLAHHDKSTQTRSDRHIHPALEPRMSDSLKTLLVIAFLIVIVWNLGAGLYYLLVDRGQTKRTVNALTRRIAVSVALIVLVIVSIYMGWIKPHGVGG